MQDHAQNNNKNCFFLNCIDTRKIFYKAHIKLHIDYESEVLDDCDKVCLKKLNSLRRFFFFLFFLFLPDPSLFTEQTMSALGILNLPQKHTYNKGVFMHKVLNNNSPIYLAQLFISHQSPTLTPGITSKCQGQGLNY